MTNTFDNITVRLSKKDDHANVKDLNFTFESNTFTSKWQNHFLHSQQRQDPISEPWAIYGNKYWTKERAINHINEMIDICNRISPSMFAKKISESYTQDDMNYIHSVFEKHHGKLDEWLDNPVFQNDKANELRLALSAINQAVHRLEDDRQYMRVVYFDTPKTQRFTNEDYALFTASRTFGGLYTLYADVGKNLESLATDNDNHHHDFVPNTHLSSDFIIYFYDNNGEYRKSKSDQYLEKNWQYFEDKGYKQNDPRLTIGAIKLASLNYENKQDVIDTVTNYDNIQSAFLH